MLTLAELAVASDLAAKGAGWEDICWRLSITDRRARQQIRAIVLRLPLSREMRDRLARARRQTRPPPVNSTAPITLPSVSLCGND